MFDIRNVMKLCHRSHEMKVLNTQIEPTFIKKIKVEAESREFRILLQSEISVKI